jgi:hypothetical protein
MVLRFANLNQVVDVFGQDLSGLDVVEPADELPVNPRDARMIRTLNDLSIREEQSAWAGIKLTMDSTTETLTASCSKLLRIICDQGIGGQGA